MVALLHHQPDSAGRSWGFDPGSGGSSPLRLVAGGAGDPAEVSPFGSIREGRPRLELVPSVDGPARPSAAVVVAVALAVFGLFGALRVVQGSPSTVTDAVGGSGVGAAVVAEDDRVVIAGAGDTLWSIATSLSPDGDPRPAVAALIEANGGESVQIGQQIVIPARLLD